MATATERGFSRALSSVLHGLNLSLKQQQEAALKAFLFKKDVFATLPTGFGKSLIYQLAPLVAKTMGLYTNSVVVVVSPLVALMEQQVKEASKLGVTAMQLGEQSDKEIFSGKALNWIVEEIKNKGLSLSPIIIYCRTLKAIGRVFCYLKAELEHRLENTLVGMYHSQTLPPNKSYVLSPFSGEGNCRVAVATTALGMGLNFPNVSHVVLYGVPEDVEGIVQETGRAGRNGAQSHAVIYCIKQHTNVDHKVKALLKSGQTTCLRKSLYTMSSLCEEIDLAADFHFLFAIF
uniref:DNA 3'-5' helicase n=1 Tax=Acanthochromis polyacanthus TaxID=80966 RepID=A0A3Q1FAZ7_9TELE